MLQQHRLRPRAAHEGSAVTRSTKETRIECTLRLDGSGSSGDPAHGVVEEIRAAGGEAVAHYGDVATPDGAASLVTTALETYGRLDTLVNNAGFLRDRMLVNLEEDDWDAVVRVHLKGHFLPLRHAAAYWRTESKAGRAPRACVINTSSGAGLSGSVGQGCYSAAKAGILGLTLVAAAELAAYGVRVNAIAPAARTRMTERTFADTVRPFLATYCISCHGREKPKAQLLGVRGAPGNTLNHTTSYFIGNHTSRCFVEKVDTRIRRRLAEERLSAARGGGGPPTPLCGPPSRRWRGR